MSNVIINYMISYDAFSSSSFSDKLLAFIKENGKVVAWTKPFDGVYFIKSSSGLDEISTSMRSFFGDDLCHFVCPVAPEYINGIAIPEIWSWIKANSVPQIAEWVEKS